MTAKADIPALTDLANLLILRHMRVSIPEWRVRQHVQKGRSTEPLLERKVRCIAVVGAGGSAPLLGRGDELADVLEKQFSAHTRRREDVMYRLQRVYRFDPRDFETRLAALVSCTPEASQLVPKEIAKRYGYRHPSLLGYELLAHLLKHRFLDAIITFNFDELLDQSLDDELSVHSYRRLVSDRDCTDVNTDPDSAEYLPLYVKLHGTASEPDSLRFTREDYYELSENITTILKDLFKSDLCVVMNVGSGMSGFDLHRLLRIPKGLEVFDLSPSHIDEQVRQEITNERLTPKPDSYAPSQGRGEPVFPMAEDGFRSKRRRSCDAWLKLLVNEIDRRSENRASPETLRSLVRSRPVDRHEAVSAILGAEARLAGWLQDREKYHEDYIEYLKHRTILELAFSGAKARGLAQLSWLALDRCGTYYELYRREADKNSGERARWRDLCTAAGLDENGWLPDVVESQPDLCTDSAKNTVENGSWALREFAPRDHAAHVAREIGRSDPSVKDRIARTLRNLQSGSEVEVQPTDDRVCAKAFESPVTLTTLTALNVFTMWLFNDLTPDDHVYISCETGEWLLSNTPMADLIMNQKYVEVITAFDLKRSRLNRKFGQDKLKIHVINPWRHNRHMTIVCQGNMPQRAVYFARRLRTPLITPVYLRDSEDAARLKRAWDLMLVETSNAALPDVSLDP